VKIPIGAGGLHRHGRSLPIGAAVGAKHSLETNGCTVGSPRPPFSGVHTDTGAK